MKKINIKYFMPPGEILHCTAQSWLIFTRLAKITSSYTIDSERGARASRKLAAFGPRYALQAFTPFFQAKATTDKAAGRRRAGIRHA